MKKFNRILALALIFTMLFAGNSSATETTEAEVEWKNIVVSDGSNVNGNMTYTFGVDEDGVYNIKIYNKDSEDVSDNFWRITESMYPNGINKSEDDIGTLVSFKAGVEYTVRFSTVGNSVVSNNPKDEYTISIAKKSDNYVTTLNGLDNGVDDDTEFFEKILAMFVLLMGKALYGLISIVIGGKISLDNLIFDEYGLTALSFFSADNKYFDHINPLFESTGGAAIMLNKTFGIFRKLAILAYVVMLVYLGIRILFASTAASKKAKAQDIFINWIKGIAILFLFPYVIRYVILLNHGFVTFIREQSKDILGTTSEASFGTDEKGLENAENVEIEETGYMGEMYKKATDNYRLSYAVCWFIMIMQLVQFLIVYLKRLITVVFLIAIFPLVTLTYPLDKLGDGKAQAFGNWFKEFLLQVFIQSFHAINYVLVMGIVLKVDNWFVRIIGISYVAKGGDILRALFAQMKGGLKDGGPMKVAKSLIGAKVAIDAVGSLKGTASKLVGSQSLLGKGVGRIADARNGAINSRMQKWELEAYGAVRTRTESGETSSTAVEGLITDDKVEKNIDELLYGNLSDEEKKERLDKLAGATDEQLNRAFLKLQSDYKADPTVLAKLGEVSGAVTHAVAFSVLTGRKHTNLNVHQSVDIVLNDRSRGGNNLINSYTRASGVSDSQLVKIRNAHSIEVDKTIPSVTSTPSTKTKSELASEAVSGMLNARNGANITDLNRQYAMLEEGLATGDTDVRKAIADNFADGPDGEEFKAYFKDFGMNLAVQTLNNSDSLEGPDAQDMVDKSIRTVNMATNEDRPIVNNMRVKKENLHIGYMPIHNELSEDEEEYNSIKEKMKDALAEDKYAIPISDEEMEYRQKKYADSRKAVAKDAIAGVAMVAAGAIGDRMKLGFVGATTSAMVGTASDGKEDLVTEMLKVVPTGLKVSESIADNATSPIKLVGNEVNDRFLKHSSLDVERQARAINDEHYSNQRIIDATNKEIRDKEIIKSRLEERLNKLRRP